MNGDGVFRRVNHRGDKLAVQRRAAKTLRHAKISMVETLTSHILQ